MTSAFPLAQPSWAERLQTTLSSDALLSLARFVEAERQRGPVYPPPDRVLHALELTAFEDTRVVVLGQDPYHGPNQAQGLAFSVAEGVKLPPSLRNIYREIERDLGRASTTKGDLTAWARQGVLLLNATLTVSEGRAGSHSQRGWETLTDRIVSLLDAEREGLVFLLWGSHAQQKAAFVDRKRHLVLEAPHPSPLSAHRGFLGCGHFSKTNAWLVSRGMSPIDW